jgi:hypothetical protein
MADQTDAVTMAKAGDVDAKAFRAALRAARLPWHLHGARWVVTKESSEHGDMKRVLADLKASRGV